MPYHKLQFPPGTPIQILDRARKQLDPLFADVHAMLMLPLPRGNDGLDQAGCNLTSALILLNIVGGISRARDGSGKPTEIFLDTMERFFPWDQEPDRFEDSVTMTGLRAAEALYYLYRNPLTHSLGSSNGKSPTESFDGQSLVTKGPMDDATITQIEQSNTRPPFRQPTLSDHGTSRRLFVPSLYWGVRTLTIDVFKSIAATSQQAKSIPDKSVGIAPSST